MYYDQDHLREFTYMQLSRSFHTNLQLGDDLVPSSMPLGLGWDIPVEPGPRFRLTGTRSPFPTHHFVIGGSRDPLGGRFPWTPAGREAIDDAIGRLAFPMAGFRFIVDADTQGQTLGTSHAVVTIRGPLPEAWTMASTRYSFRQTGLAETYHLAMLVRVCSILARPPTCSRPPWERMGLPCSMT